jgi:hypothetical protein
MRRIFQSGPRQSCQMREWHVTCSGDMHIHDLVWLVDLVKAQQKGECCECAHDGKTRTLRLKRCISRALSL